MNLEQAEKDRQELEQCRQEFMADDTPVKNGGIPQLITIAKKLHEGDTSLNVYELYKHPEARAKIFSQIAEACYMLLDLTATQEQRLAICDYLEQRFNAILKKMISRTDKEAPEQLLDALGLPLEQEKQFIRDMAASGLLSKN